MLSLQFDSHIVDAGQRVIGQCVCHFEEVLPGLLYFDAADEARRLEKCRLV